VTHRIAQIHADHKYALDNTMIETWGVNTFDDLFMKFMIDNDKLSGPMLTHRQPRNVLSYQPGWFSVFRGYENRVGTDMAAHPYARDNFRHHATNGVLSDGSEQNIAEGYLRGDTMRDANDRPVWTGSVPTPPFQGGFQKNTGSTSASGIF
jgi:hypothetical protein